MPAWVSVEWETSRPIFQTRTTQVHQPPLAAIVLYRLSLFYLNCFLEVGPCPQTPLSLCTHSSLSVQTVHHPFHVPQFTGCPGYWAVSPTSLLPPRTASITPVGGWGGLPWNMRPGRKGCPLRHVSSVAVRSSCCGVC